MATIHAIYKNGVFRPHGPVELPESSEVVFEPVLVTAEQNPSPTPQTDDDDPDSQDEIYEILSRRYNSGDPHGAARHNEHAP